MKHSGIADTDTDGWAALVEAGVVFPPSAETVKATQRTVREEIQRDLARGVVPLRQARRRRRRVLLAVVTAGLVVVLAMAVPTFRLFGAGPSASASAATFLRGVAAVAKAQPGQSANAPFWYTHSKEQSGGVTIDRQLWLGRDASGRLIQTGGSGPQPPSVLRGPALFPIGKTQVTWDQLTALPTDAGQLLDVLTADAHGAGPDPDSELFTVVGDLLRESPAGPELRAALYRVAADVPGVRLLGQVTDSLGRTGTAVARTQGDGRVLEYVIQSSSGRLLEERDDGMVTTYLAQGAVATTTALPSIPPSVS